MNKLLVPFGVMFTFLALPLMTMSQSPGILCPSPEITTDLKRSSADPFESRHPVIRTRGEVTALQEFLWQYRGQFEWRIDRIKDKDDFTTGFYGDTTTNVVKSFQDQFAPDIKGTIEYGRVLQKTRDTIYTQCGSVQPIPQPDIFDYSILGSGDIQLTRGESANNIITVRKVSGIAKDVALSIGGLPARAAASFSPVSCMPSLTCQSILAIQTAAQTPVGSYQIIVMGSAGSAMRQSLPFVLTVSESSLPPRQDSTLGFNNRVALLVLTNQSRSDPSAYDFPVVPPLAWNDNLARVAQEHSEDMAAHNCYQHNSCDGTYWASRIRKYYNSTWLGENITYLVNTPQTIHAGWMGSSGHRANILRSSFTEMGSGMALGRDGFGPTTLTTVDYGSGRVGTFPTLPAGAVLPATAFTNGARAMLVNYYHQNGRAPQAVRAIVGSSCISLPKVTGKTDNYATYGGMHTFTGNGCTPVVFEAIRSDGVKVRYPATGAILVASGSATCDERTTETPTTNCGTSLAPAQNAETVSRLAETLQALKSLLEQLKKSAGQ
ncbi:MAG: hypothetical protein A3G60_02340 [Candidatus Ryanbacteria bacterium RIFCSPLOWO2_12_FULL_47_9c]|uniref:SCP domain-containing protein n=2 Tax=Candidatus Ryaniibacteriota TaxID=1817914 RepID=A0A1G2H742_9BACT|nr:MAG: hypothetical protein UX74_C0006G0011 [Parcubacteria group bacterium GW2011_GWA2_47_10b]OGZ46660.1 MAG: hypothetical protein A2844_00855 [Candidatus Ryanbacteria bacterium RIFCSPHIGHO2_01_FULL_48_80]OGZ53038.1 MAG: hypothetical protein A3A29_01180 [Candidatus Ryanbacteria bacterium RIFCSPLOWO2_01_FULL_47_79]OGZ57041.1 MAG: hypothetical protein A3J04_00560 [Candidatus Ryanbacteria bacterium RIFCSPLOWO2_02_FULL_47_14]OGZ58169.1 MAG: hypothetical protein A3G60_02340 [Candidatus Ryanbacteria